VRAIAFDVDGVLIDSVAVHRAVWATWAQGHGLDVDVDVVWRATFGRRPEDTVAEFGRGVDPVAERLRLDRLLEAHEHRVVPLPGAKELLGGLARRRGPWPRQAVAP
jgi:sugar-phosphatase